MGRCFPAMLPCLLLAAAGVPCRADEVMDVEAAIHGHRDDDARVRTILASSKADPWRIADGIRARRGRAEALRIAEWMPRSFWSAGIRPWLSMLPEDDDAGSRQLLAEARRLRDGRNARGALALLRARAAPSADPFLEAELLHETAEAHWDLGERDRAREFLWESAHAASSIGWYSHSSPCVRRACRGDAAKESVVEAPRERVGSRVRRIVSAVSDGWLVARAEQEGLTGLFVVGTWKEVASLSDEILGNRGNAPANLTGAGRRIVGSVRAALGSDVAGCDIVVAGGPVTRIPLASVVPARPILGSLDPPDTGLAIDSGETAGGALWISREPELSAMLDRGRIPRDCVGVDPVLFATGQVDRVAKKPGRWRVVYVVDPSAAGGDGFFDWVPDQLGRFGASADLAVVLERRLDLNNRGGDDPRRREQLRHLERIRAEWRRWGRAESPSSTLDAMLSGNIASLGVTSHWPTDREAALAFLSALHTCWTDPARTPGNPRERLLRCVAEAVEQVRSDPRWRHPFYWAGWQAWQAR